MRHTLAWLLGLGLQHLLQGWDFAGSPSGPCFPQLGTVIGVGVAIGDLYQGGQWAAHKGRREAARPGRE